jgi:hypothetical protein
VTRTMARWEAEGRPRGSLCTTCQSIDIDGNPLPGEPPLLPPSPVNLAAWARAPFPLVVGASHAFHRDLYRLFGPLLPDRGSEDMPLAMRALALDGVFYIPEPLVLYRRHQGNAAGYIEDRKTLKQALLEEHIRHERRAGFLEQVLVDFRNPAFERKWGGTAMHHAERAVKREYRRQQLLSAWKSSVDGVIPGQAVRMAWQWPPFLWMGFRLLLRRLFPVMHRMGFRYGEWRWQRAYRGRHSL